MSQLCKPGKIFPRHKIRKYYLLKWLEIYLNSQAWLQISIYLVYQVQRVISKESKVVGALNCCSIRFIDIHVHCTAKLNDREILLILLNNVIMTRNAQKMIIRQLFSCRTLQNLHKDMIDCFMVHGWGNHKISNKMLLYWNIQFSDLQTDNSPLNFVFKHV